MTTRTKRRYLPAIVAAAASLPLCLVLSQTQGVVAAPLAPSTLGMRASGGFPDQGRLDRYERDLGRPLSWYVAMAGRNSTADMKGSVYGQLAASDAVLPKIAHRTNLVMTIPLAFGKGSARSQAGRAAIRSKLLETADGAWDDDYRKVAERLIEGGYPDAVIRLGHEFTGAWYPWSSQGNHDAYIEAFRHVHDVMSSVAPRLRFDWNSARNTFGEFGQSAYPGDAYVDVISMDVYYEPWKGDPAQLTDDVWERRYLGPLQAHRDFARKHGKPVAYPEWANGGIDQPKFIEKMHQWFTSLPAGGGGGLLYHSYFNVSNDTYDLDRHPRSKARYLDLFGRSGSGSGAPVAPVTTIPPATTTTTIAPITTTPPSTTVPPAANESQFTFFDQEVVHRADDYATLDASAPSDWTKPRNFTEGRVFLRLDIVDKPSNLPVQVLVCMWRDRYTQERCVSAGVFETAGETWVEVGKPKTWYNRVSWDWDRPIDFVRILVKDAATGSLLTSKNCGTACYSGTKNLANHTPIVFDAAMVVVAPGAKLRPLAGWDDCPVSFSEQCTTTNSPVAGPPTVSVAASMAAMIDQPVTIPADIDADTINWWRVAGGAMEWSNRTVEQPTVTFHTAGTYVLRVAAKRDGENVRADVRFTVSNPSITTTPPTSTPVGTTPPTTVAPASRTGPKVVTPRTFDLIVDEPATIPARIDADQINWWRVSGPAMLWSDRSVEQPTVTFRKPGKYLLRVATHRDGQIIKRDIDVTVRRTAP